MIGLKMNEITRKRQLSECNLPENIKQLLSDRMKENIPPLFTQAVNPVDNICLQNDTAENGCGSRTPKKSKGNLEEPVTPNTNFKLLTSLAATRDYAKCSTPKSSRNCETLESQTSCDSDVLELSTSKVNRKDKSLAIICTRFLSMYPIYPAADKMIIVSLDEACIRLGVERRRLYDIVNVFESIDILTKNAKNQYLWYGKNKLLSSLQNLKAAAIKENMLEKLQYVLKSECDPTCKQSCILSEVQNFNKTFENSDSSVFPVTPPPELRKEKSLSIMSQKFLMLFLVSPNKIISLGVAAKVLNGFLHRNEKGAQIKTQIRRLYDIANVLSSVGLIQKEVAVAHHGRKPAFKYIGPDLKDSKENLSDFSQSSLQLAVNSSKSRSLARHSSFQDICAVAEMEHKKLHLDQSHNSAPPFDTTVTVKKENIATNFVHLIDTNLKNNKSNEDLTIEKPKIRPQIIMKPAVKVINFGKSSANPNMPYYILTEKDIKKSNSACGAQTYLLINNIAPSKEIKLKTARIQTVNQVSSPQTIPLSPQQRDAILQSLNISLSSEQVAAIHLDGSSQSTNNTDSPCNVLKIMSRSNMPKERDTNSNLSLKDLEQVSNSNTRNSSPNSMQALYSPLSIPSGYVTPIPTATSEMLFVSNVEVNDILKKIESQPNFAVLNGKSNPSVQDTLKVCSTTSTEVKPIKNEVSVQKGNEEQDLVNNQYSTNNGFNRDNFSNNQMSQFISSDSCSNDSINLEVSSIFRGRNLGDATKPKPFLIDEKTILSPIKKPHTLALNTPSTLITPPYIVPESVFVFSTPLAYQSVGDTSSHISNIPNLVENKKILPKV